MNSKLALEFLGVSIIRAERIPRAIITPEAKPPEVKRTSEIICQDTAIDTAQDPSFFLLSCSIAARR